MDSGAWWAAVHRVAQSQTQLKWLIMHACVGEANGNSLQYSCLENPRDRGAWWAAVYGVAQSRTRLSDWTELIAIIGIIIHVEYKCKHPYPYIRLHILPNTLIYITIAKISKTLFSKGRLQHYVLRYYNLAWFFFHYKFDSLISPCNYVYMKNWKGGIVSICSFRPVWLNGL